MMYVLHLQLIWYSHRDPHSTTIRIIPTVPRYPLECNHNNDPMCWAVPRYMMKRFNDLQLHIMALPAYDAAEVVVYMYGTK